MIRQGSRGAVVREVIVHASATKPAWKANQPFADQVKEIRRWHVAENGWRDIGYHWLISRRGEIARGRLETQIGAHVAGHNAGTIGICLIGGWGSRAGDQPSQHFTAEQLDELYRLIREIQVRADVTLTVSGHNRYDNKACPGFNATAWYAKRRLEEEAQNQAVSIAQNALARFFNRLFGGR